MPILSFGPLAALTEMLLSSFVLTPNIGFCPHPVRSRSIARTSGIVFLMMVVSLPEYVLLNDYIRNFQKRKLRSEKISFFRKHDCPSVMVFLDGAADFLYDRDKSM